jgi:asparagine synthase (glutamine-hydrolysing)
MQESARLTVPGGPSVACSTAAAIAWDKAWANNLDPSGRAATGVHDSAYEADAAADIAENHKGTGHGGLVNLKVVDKVQEVSAVA